MNEKLSQAREDLNAAIYELEKANRVWSECVTNLHMAELSMRQAQKHMRDCYHLVGDLLNGTV